MTTKTFRAGVRGGLRSRESIGLWLRGLRVQSPSFTPDTSKTSSDLTDADRRLCQRLAAAQVRGEITYQEAQGLLRSAA